MKEDVLRKRRAVTLWIRSSLLGAARVVGCGVHQTALGYREYGHSINVSTRTRRVVFRFARAGTPRRGGYCGRKQHFPPPFCRP